MKIKILCFIGAFFGFVGMVKADLYDVQGVPVSAELDSPNEAREMAIANGQVDAFWKLMQKMISESDLQYVPMMDSEKVLNLVQNVSLSDEKATATKYMATLDVRFKPTAVQDFLSQNRIPFLIQDLTPTVLIPIFQKDGEIFLLDDNNPVYQFLKERELSGAVWDVIVPTGDLEEMMLARQIWTGGDMSAWDVFARRYNRKRVVLMTVVQRGPYVTVKVLGPAVQDMPAEQTFDIMLPFGDITAEMDNIWKQVVSLQENAWRMVQTNDFSTPQTFWVSVPISDLSEWVLLQEKIKQADFLSGFDVRGFQPNDVLIVLQYKGGGEQLNEKLKTIGLTLTEPKNGNLWELSVYVAEEEGV